jgi:hypothetical protein
MAMGIGIGMGISGAQQNVQLVTGWFQVDATCAFVKPSNPYTAYLTNVPYKQGDYVQTKISGPYAGKRILLGAYVTSTPGSGITLIDIEPGSLVYNACQT